MKHSCVCTKQISLEISSMLSLLAPMWSWKKSHQVSGSEKKDIHVNVIGSSSKIIYDKVKTNHTTYNTHMCTFSFLIAKDLGSLGPYASLSA